MTERLHYRSQTRQHGPWTPAHVAYAQRVQICLAVELNTDEGHPDYGGRRPQENNNPYTTAAKFLGAVGTGRADVLMDLTELLRIHGVEPTGTVEEALTAARPELADLDERRQAIQTIMGNTRTEI